MEKVQLTLKADGTVHAAAGSHLANLMNYKIRTEVDLGNKSLNTLSMPTTVVDLGKQLLQFARDGDVKGVKNMLSRGAPFTADWLGMSALHFAAMNNQFEICDALLKGGINKDSRTKVDRTPLHVACFYGNEAIVELLLSKKCIVNARDMLRMTPLHWAVEKGHKSIVRLLLKNNADVTVLSKFSKTPIALAVLTEQADILEELEAARQLQVSRKFSEETEKETSDAVNSIMGMSNYPIEDSNVINKIELMDTEDELTNSNDFAETKTSHFSNIKDHGVLDNNTINLLKSHGIAMMQDDDDASKDLLTTALKNGRQLVLSEGGKLLLHETNKKIQIQNNNNSINKNNNNNNTIVPMRVKNDQELISMPTASNINKIRPNIISKAKDNPGIVRNKNIRIISLNDFKKLYGNTSLKAMQKLPTSMASSRLARQMSVNTQINNNDSPTFTNARQNRQLKQPTSAIKSYEIIQEMDDSADPMSNIIQLAPTDSSEAETSDTDYRPHPVKSSPMCIIPTSAAVAASRHNNQMGPVKVHQIPLPTNAKQQSNNAEACAGAGAGAIETTKHFQQTSTSAVIPLLTMPEICRQLFEMRKQNDELTRKFDLAQKEKDELRLRVDRLEGLLLVEKSDEDYIES